MAAKVESGVEVAEIAGRRVLQPACNRVVSRNNNNDSSILNKKPRKSIPSANNPNSSPNPNPNAKASAPVSPKLAKATAINVSPPTSPSSASKASRIKPVKPKGANTAVAIAETASETVQSCDKPNNKLGSSSPASGAKSKGFIAPKKPRSASCSAAAGSIAAARKAEISERYTQKKMRISHYGRKQGSPQAPAQNTAPVSYSQQQQHITRCSFITPNSDPAYVAYHDQEWGVPVHDDRMLFEILVLMGAQVGMNWPTILSKRESFSEAFAGFDLAIVATFSEKKIASINVEYGIMDVPKIRGIVENAKQILEVVKEFGSFDRYIWSFVNYTPILNNYKYARNVPVKTSKAESISKDMVKRNFRFVGPTIIHSFMQAAGLTNDHLVNCFRHKECIRLSEQGHSGREQILVTSDL